MNRQPAAGPSATAEWANRQAGTGSRSLPILVLPDAALPDLYYAVPKVPQIVRDDADHPVFSLSLVLRRRPAADDDTIFPLIESGSFACDLTIGLPDGAPGGGTLLPLYARQAQFRLMKLPHDKTDLKVAVVAEATGQGANVRVGLAGALDREGAQAVLIALLHGESKMALACRVTYRTAESRLVVHLAARWVDVYDALKKNMSADGSLTQSALQRQLSTMAQSGVLKAHRVEPSGLDADAAETNEATVWSAFSKVRALLLDTVATDAHVMASEPRYTLRDRPDPSLTLDVRLAVTTGNEASVDLDAPLEDVVGGALDRLDADAFIRLSYVDAGGRGGVHAVPRRMRSAATREAPDGTGGAPAGFAAVGGHLVSLTRALRPDAGARPLAHALLASDAVRPHAGISHAFVLSDVALGRIDGGDPPEPHLPVVDDPAAPLWVDKADAGRFWYAPDFRLAPADPSADPDASTFRFTFKETGHDDRGRPVLEGDVLFTLVRGVGADTQAALQARGNPRAEPVPANGLSASLRLPVRDTTGQLRQIDLAGTVTDKGGAIEVRVPLLNDYLRVAYGDLAIANFQASPAQLTLAYTFDTIAPAPEPNSSLQYVGKIVVTPVAYSAIHARELADVPFVDAERVAYRSPAADLVYQREMPALPADELATAGAAQPRGAALAAVAMHGGAVHAAALQPAAAATAVVPSHASLVVAAPFHPQMEEAIRIQDILRQKRYARQTQGRTATVTTFFGCNTLGGFYRQDLGDRMVSIGCQDSFSLGQTAFKLFEPVDDPALASNRYKVYRSLSQPGHFLVVPAAYRITRYAATEGDRAYRPTVYLYSSLDPQNAANNRCVVMASLQPDLPAWERKSLAVKLAALHHSPVLQYATEIDAEVTYTWSLDGGVASIQPRAAKQWDGFQVTLSSDLAGGLQLQAMLRNSGVTADAHFTLQDGTTVSSSLILDLAALTGPWTGGPIDTTIVASHATLTNHIERGVNVSDLAIYAADGRSQVVRVDRLLAPAAAVTIDLPFAPNDAYSVYAVQPGDPAQLSETSSFVEDIRTNVVFVNLVNYANHNLKRLDLRARLKEAAGSEIAVAISEADPVGEADFLLPLTTYLGPRTLQLEVTKTDTSDHATTTPWLEWDLAARGNVVSLTWDLIGT